MKIKDFVIGALCGIAAGALTTIVINKQTNISSDDVLHKIKKVFNEKGKVTGSWIMTKPETIDKNSILYKVYRGGLTVLVDEEQVNYEFLADAKTGVIIDIASQ